MNLGFTGTREGMTPEQLARLAAIMIRLKVTGQHVGVFRHGGCRGADVEAARAMRAVWGANLSIVCHPGIYADGRDGSSASDASDSPNQVDSGVDDERLAPKTHFARNRDIVNNCDVLLACPVAMAMLSRGGTSYTVDYATKNGVPVWIIWPDGTTTGVNEGSGKAGGA